MQQTQSTFQRCLTALACPACRAPTEATPDASDTLRCSTCHESFACRDEIWDFLKQDEDNTFDDESQQQAYYDEGAADTLESGRNIPCHYNKIDGILQAANRIKNTGSLDTVCEVGVGTALHAAWFMQQMPEPAFIGIDLSHRVLMNGRSRWSKFPQFLALLGSAYRLPLANDSIDLLYYSGTLHHCQHPDAAIAEAARVIRPGGLLVLSEPVWYFPTNLYYNLRIPEEYGQRLLRRPALRSWCEQANLRIDSIEHFNFLPRPKGTDRVVTTVESLLRQLPVLSRFSSMFRITAQRLPAKAPPA